VLAAGAVIAGHVVGLAASPPGLYSDEASIGYNAWTIAHFGTDQYGTPWPLLFRDFGDYKSPLSTYPLAPLTLFLPLTPTVTRLPSAFAGIALALMASLLAWRLTSSRLVASLILLETAFEPWFFHTARIDLEADLFTVLCFVIAFAALARGGAARVGACVVAGLAVALATFAAQPGRYFALVMLVLIVVTHFPTLRWKRAVVLAAPVALAALVLLLGTSGHATARLAGVSVFDHQPVAGGIAAWIRNYFQYFSPDFLFLHGDPNPRHSSGFGGLLFLTTIPLLVLGIAVCIRGWREPMCRLALAGIIVAPLGPALTTGISARRDIVVLPFLILLLTFGWEAALRFLRGRRFRMLLAGALIGASAGAYLVDYATAYPVRAAHAFDTGVVPALVAAHRAAGDRTILVSRRIQDLRELALFALLPAPGPGDVLRQLHMTLLVAPSQLAAMVPGDVAVLTGADPAPPGSVRIDRETITGPGSLGGPPSTIVLLDVYVRR